MWEFGKIPLDIVIAILFVLLLEVPFAWAIALKVNALIEWINDHETD